MVFITFQHSIGRCKYQSPKTADVTLAWTYFLYVSNHRDIFKPKFQAENLCRLQV